MKPSTYLETSVIGAYLDNGEPFRRDLTIRWWEHELSEYRAVISPLVVSELERVAEPHRSAYLKLVRGLEQVELAEEAACDGAPCAGQEGQIEMQIMQGNQPQTEDFMGLEEVADVGAGEAAAEGMGVLIDL